MNVRVKGLLILGVLLVALYYVFPTYRAYFTNADPLSVEGKLNLELDLQGGMYLDVEVKAGEAVRGVTRRTAQELEDVMIDEQIDFIEVRQTSPTEAVIEMESGKTVDLEVSPFDRFIVQYDLLTEGNLIRLTLRPDEIKRIRKNAIKQALEVPVSER